MTDRLLTLDEACEIVQLSPWPLRRAIARGELHAFKPGNRIRISEGALAAWLESTASGPAPTTSSARRRPRAGQPSRTFRERVRPQDREQREAALDGPLA